MNKKLSKQNHKILFKRNAIKQLSEEIGVEITLFNDVSKDLIKNIGLRTIDAGITGLNITNNEAYIVYVEGKIGKVSKHDFTDFMATNIILSKNFKVYPFVIIGNKTVLFDGFEELGFEIKIYDFYETINKFENEQPNNEQTDNKLRNYQLNCLKAMNTTKKKKFNICIACGCGKTLIMKEFIKQHKNKTFCVLVPTISLAEQTVEVLKDIGKIGKCFTGHKNELTGKIDVYVYNSFNNKKHYDYMFIDEAHHVVNSENNDNSGIKESYLRTIAKYNPNIRTFNLSATLENYDFKYGFDKAIEEKFLNDYILSFLITNDKFETLIEFRRILFEEYTIIYTNTIKECEDLTDRLKKYFKQPFNCYHSKMSLVEREKVLSNFKKFGGTIISVNALGEGINIPIIKNCILYNRRYSKINIAQILGRALRKCPEKGNYSRLIVLSNYEDSKQYLRRILESLAESYEDKMEYINKFVEFKNYEQLDVKIPDFVYEVIKQTIIRTDDKCLSDMVKDYITKFGEIDKSKNILKIDINKEAYKIPEKDFVYQFKGVKFSLGAKLYTLRYRKDNLKKEIEILFNRQIIPTNEAKEKLKINEPSNIEKLKNWIETHDKKPRTNKKGGVSDEENILGRLTEKIYITHQPVEIFNLIVQKYGFLPNSTEYAVERYTKFLNNELTEKEEGNIKKSVSKVLKTIEKNKTPIIMRNSLAGCKTPDEAAVFMADKLEKKENNYNIYSEKEKFDIICEYFEKDVAKIPKTSILSWVKTMRNGNLSKNLYKHILLKYKDNNDIIQKILPPKYKFVEKYKFTILKKYITTYGKLPTETNNHEIIYKGWKYNPYSLLATLKRELKKDLENEILKSDVDNIIELSECVKQELETLKDVELVELEQHEVVKSKTTNDIIKNLNIINVNDINNNTTTDINKEELRNKISEFKVVDDLDILQDTELTDQDIDALKVKINSYKTICDEIIIRHKIVDRLKERVQFISKNVFDEINVDVERTQNGNYNFKFKNPTIGSFNIKAGFIVWVMRQHNLINFSKRLGNLKTVSFKGYNINIYNICSYIKRYSKIYSNIISELVIPSEILDSYDLMKNKEYWLDRINDVKNPVIKNNLLIYLQFIYEKFKFPNDTKK